ncbi:type IV secretion protein Rhs [Bacillus thuringiensis serovar malayensis]|nr:type IV secretion protein Rhs [Bacillus thuringiensis serovar malayensis]HDR7321428.1 RHS repeat-associated core domain-containing protein [Bacillus toyonensis]
MKAQGQTLFYHYNPRGDVVAMTDQNGQVVANYEYDAWGNVLKSDTKGIAADNPFGYAGYMYDKEIGMYYLIARYYNPDHGVFISVDPDPGDQDDPVTQNGYTYGDNNPVMMVDPDGHLAWFAPLAIVGARVVGKYAVRYGVKYGKKAAKWVGNKAKDAWKNRKYTIQGPSKRNGRIFAIVNRKKKQTKSTDSRLFGLDYHQIRENKKRTTRKVLHFHWNYKKNKHYIIYPKRSKVKWK